MHSGRHPSALVMLTLALAWLASSPPARSSTATGISDPPPYPRQALPVDAVAADPFTKTAAGLAPGQIELTTLSARGRRSRATAARTTSSARSVPARDPPRSS